MRIAFIIYEGMTALDFVGIYDPLTRLKTMGFKDDLEWEICAFSEPVYDISGLRFTPTQVNPPLSGYDLLVVPGGFGSRNLTEDSQFIAWLRTGASSSLIVSVCTGSLLLGAAGFLKGKRATTHPGAYSDLEPYCAEVSHQRIVDEGEVITAGGVTSAIDLGLYLVQKLAGSEVRQKIQQQMVYPGDSLALNPQAGSAIPQKREARILRHTKETRIDLFLSLDGDGTYDITTGIGFLDHMLAHIAVHGLFDLTLKADGDLFVDVHHTVEDVALVLGQAFAQALGDRQGIRRMASVVVPMDEALAFVAVDFSGRPYAVMETDWNGPEAGGIPTSLFTHFFESFAIASRCNLHARLISGRDDHHRAEALFKALARALDEATQIDPRRGASVPSTKGSLTQ